MIWEHDRPFIAKKHALEYERARAQYLDLIFNYIARQVRPISEAEDVCATVFVEAYKHWHKCKGDAKPWLFGIARRKVSDHLRRKKVLLNIREEDAQGNAMADFESASLHKEAKTVLNQLNAQEQEVLLLSVVEELTVAEIAAVIGRSEKATNSLLGRTRSKVRAIVGEPQGESK